MPDSAAILVSQQYSCENSVIPQQKVGMWKRWKIEIESAKANFESSTVVSLLQGHIHNVNSKQGTAKSGGIKIEKWPKSLGDCFGSTLGYPKV